MGARGAPAGREKRVEAAGQASSERFVCLRRHPALSGSGIDRS